MNDLLKKLVKRIKAQNGLVVNADVWQQAHDYHRFHQQAHTLLSHGSGIVAGLTVRAEQSGSRRVWIEPGIAVDPQGQMIILDEQTSYEVKVEHQGFIYLYLEGAGTSLIASNGSSGKGLQYERDGYILESGVTVPHTALELARIRVADREGEIKDASNPQQPGLNELDLRFRQQLAAKPPKVAGVAISYLGSTGDSPLKKFGDQAATGLGQALSHLAHHQVWIDDDVPLSTGLLPYTLVYLVEQGPAKLQWSDVEALQAYLQEKKGLLLVENFQSEEKDSELLQFLAEQGEQLEEISSREHPLLTGPFPFGLVPPGAREMGRFQISQRAIFSSRGYGHLWRREDSQGQPAEREKIRASLEWATNILRYAVNLRQAQTST